MAYLLLSPSQTAHFRHFLSLSKLSNPRFFFFFVIFRFFFYIYVYMCVYIYVTISALFPPLNFCKAQTFTSGEDKDMKGEEGEQVLAVDDLDPLLVAQCRICHDEDDEIYGAMESPCACSGSLKFAHRECIQRWCDEKGNTTCEICLQPFEPGYIAPLPPNKTRLADVAVTIRGSLEVDRQAFRRQIREAAVARDEYAECAAAAERSTHFYRFVALVLTIILLVRHLVPVLQGGGEHYAFAIFTLMILRAGGIVLPLYIILRIVEGIRRRQLQHWHQEVDDSVFENDEDGHSHQTIQIQTE